MPRIQEYIIDDTAQAREKTKEKVEADLATWAGVFALDVPNIYLQDGYDEQGVPKRLPQHSYLRKCYLDAKRKGLGFNEYALARTLKSERGEITKGYGGAKWKTHKWQYKAIASCVLCRLLGCGVRQDFNDDTMFGTNLYPQTTGLVKLAVAGVHDWGVQSGADYTRKGAAFATSKEVYPENEDDKVLIDVCRKILNGVWFIGDLLYGAVSFNHPINSSYYKKTDEKSVSIVTNWLNAEYPRGDRPAMRSMGGSSACWVGEINKKGLLPTQIRFYAKMPLKVKPNFRDPPRVIPWANTDGGKVPRIADPPAFDYARTRGILRDDAPASVPKNSVSSIETETIDILPVSNFKQVTNSKGEAVAAEHGYFVMEGHVVNTMRRISSIDWSSTTSYLKLFYYDRSTGKNKNINVDLIANSSYTQRELANNESRPKVGLLGVDIVSQETESSFETKRITVKFKVYDKSVFDPGGILFPFFYPEFPFGIEYGLMYNGEHSEDRAINNTLNWREVLMCNPTTYNLSVDEKGVYDFNVEAVSGANHAFHKFSVGSFMLDGTEGKIYDDYTEAVQNLKAIEKALEALEEEQEKVELGTKTIKKKKAQQLSKAIKTNKTNHVKQSKEAQKQLGLVLADKLSQLKEYCVENTYYKSKTKPKKKSKKQWITIGDCIRVICMDDLDKALRMYSTKSNINIGFVWGKYNSYAGDYASAPLYDFLIPFDKFTKKIREFTDLLSQPTVRLDAVMNILIGFMNDTTLYKLQKKGEDYVNFTRPDVIQYIQQDVAADGKEYVSYHVVDRQRSIDFITKLTDLTHGQSIFSEDALTKEERKMLGLPEQNVTKTQPSVAQIKNALNDYDVAYLRMLEANSFIKSIRMNAETDENIIKIAMEKMYKVNSSVYELEREDAPNDVYNSQSAATKLRLPLRGTIEVIGHPVWKPLKSLYIFMENEMWNGFYNITSTTLSFTVGAPKTSFEVMYELNH